MPDGLIRFREDIRAARELAEAIRNAGFEVELFPSYPTETERHWNIEWRKSFKLSHQFC